MQKYHMGTVIKKTYLQQILTICISYYARAFLIQFKIPVLKGKSLQNFNANRQRAPPLCCKSHRKFRNIWQDKIKYDSSISIRKAHTQNKNDTIHMQHTHEHQIKGQLSSFHLIRIDLRVLWNSQ